MVQHDEREYRKVPTKELICDEKTKNPSSYGYGVRHIQSTILFFCIVVAFMTRGHLGVTIVAMTAHAIETDVHENKTQVAVNNASEIINGTIVTNLTNKNAFNEGDFEVNNTYTNFKVKEEIGGIWNVHRTYEWNKKIQEMILSSFFLGYSLMTFPMGLICQRYGGKIPIQICLLVNGLITIATPTLAALGGWRAVCGCRILQGVSQSGLYPSTHTLLAKWVQISERATLSSYVYTGTTVGTVISFQISGSLAYSTYGWPSTFWLIGSICIVAFGLVTVFAASSPLDHKTISDEEKFFILGKICEGVQKRPKIPWKQILSSKPIWAIITTHVFCSICFVFLFTQIPTYMHFILGFDIKNSGLLSSLPYIGSFFTSVVYGVVSDFCINKGIVTLKTARIISNCLAQIVPAGCLIAVSFTNDSAFAVFLLVVAVGLYAGVHTGWMVNYIDIAPNFSGSLMAMGNTFAAMSTLSLPFLVSNIVTDVTDRFQWRIMLFLMAGMITLSNLIYVCFTTTDTQPWNEIEDMDLKETEKTKST